MPKRSRPIGIYYLLFNTYLESLKVSLITLSVPVNLLVRTPKLIPEHELLSASDAKKVIKKYNTQLEKLPKMLVNDPQAVRLNAKPGSVIVVHREDSTGKYDYYRLVVKG